MMSQKMPNCPKCGQPALVFHADYTAPVWACRVCCYSVYVTHQGEPYVADMRPVWEEPLTSMRLPPNLRTTVVTVYAYPVSSVRGHVEWRILPPVTYTVAVNYYPGTTPTAKWKIYNAEIQPSLPIEVEERDRRNLQVAIQQALSQYLIETPGELAEVVRATTTWDIDAWGYLSRCIKDPVLTSVAT